MMTRKTNILFLLLLIPIFACGQAEEALEIEPKPEESVALEYGTASGSITDAGTGNPIPGVTVRLLGQSIQTGLDGVYTFQNVLYGDTYNLIVEDPDYKPHSQNFTIKQQRVTVNIALTPLRDPMLEMQEFFDRFSGLLESLDAKNMEAIKAHFSETYVAASDDATLFGVASGIIPENYADVDPAMKKLFEEYTFLQFVFKDVQMDVTHARKAAVTVRLDVDARRGAEEDLREIRSGCKCEFRREGPDWKIVYWQLLDIDIRL